MRMFTSIAVIAASFVTVSVITQQSMSDAVYCGCISSECNTKTFTATIGFVSCPYEYAPCWMCFNRFTAIDKSDFCDIQEYPFPSPGEPVYYCSPEPDGDDVYGRYFYESCLIPSAGQCFDASSYTGYLTECHSDAGPFPCH